MGQRRREGKEEAREEGQINNNRGRTLGKAEGSEEKEKNNEKKKKQRKQVILVKLTYNKYKKGRLGEPSERGDLESLQWGARGFNGDELRRVGRGGVLPRRQQPVASFLSQFYPSHYSPLEYQGLS